MAAYRRVYVSRHLQADCQESVSAPERYLFTQYTTRGRVLPSDVWCGCHVLYSVKRVDVRNRSWLMISPVDELCTCTVSTTTLIISIITRDVSERPRNSPALLECELTELRQDGLYTTVHCSEDWTKPPATSRPSYTTRWLVTRGCSETRSVEFRTRTLHNVVMAAHYRVYDSSPAGWVSRTGISSGTLRSAIEYRLPLPFYLLFTP